MNRTKSILRFLRTPGPKWATALLLFLLAGVAAPGRIHAAAAAGSGNPTPLTVYILPHSHTDIGYTEIQTAIEKKQMENLRKGIAYARRTDSYPEGARFRWNVEVLWAADLYLERMSEVERAEFLEAVTKGWVGLNGMYLNELTGLCRPEELLRLFRFSTQLAKRCGVTIDSAMISDVPGYTWGTVPAMTQAGIRYFSTAPNYFDRIGDILVKWENKPFWWEGPSSKDRVLVWIPFKGYAMSHLHKKLTPAFVAEYEKNLKAANYPYDIAYMRWSGHGDNAEPDPEICEFVREWNGQHASPHFIISSTSDAFRAFEAKYGKDLPVVRGDWTPYWEDGAASSSLETAMNRASSDRLTQAESLWATRSPSTYPAADFDRAWRDVLLYSEHTWGADISVTHPESQKTREQWDIKQGYALEADRRSNDLLKKALALPARHLKGPVTQPKSQGPTRSIDLHNTTAWSRTELTQIPASLSAGLDRVLDERGHPVASQRLSNGDLALLAKEIPPYATRRYTLTTGQPHADGRVTVAGTTLENDHLRLRLDEASGALVELRMAGVQGNLIETGTGHGANDYLYLPGENTNNVLRSGPAKIQVIEKGPLVASLRVESDAPGCNRLTREIRLVAGQDSVELINTVDKKRAQTVPKLGDGAFAQKGGKESLNFAFPFQIPDGTLRLDIPWGMMQPEKDQMPSACKNWFTVGRWADVSNEKYGITWVTLDAPLVQIGGLTANLTGSQTNPAAWRKKVAPSQRLYSWIMNNHWHTNYRAYQDGSVVFRFLLRAHKAFSPADANRFATGRSQPLLVEASKGQSGQNPVLRVEPSDVVVESFKPSDDGKAWIIRLYGASTRSQKARIHLPGSPRISLSNTAEAAVVPAGKEIEVPALGVVTLRAELPASY